MGEHLLSWILFAPLVAMAAVLAVPAGQKNLIRIVANIGALACFIISLGLVARFDNHAAGFQFVERATWIPALGASY